MKWGGSPCSLRTCQIPLGDVSVPGTGDVEELGTVLRAAGRAGVTYKGHTDNHISRPEPGRHWSIHPSDTRMCQVDLLTGDPELCHHEAHNLVAKLDKQTDGCYEAWQVSGCSSAGSNGRQMSLPQTGVPRHFYLCSLQRFLTLFLK